MLSKILQCFTFSVDIWLSLTAHSLITAVTYNSNWNKLSVGDIFYVVLLLQVTLSASSNMHNTIFNKVLASPMKFFDTTPVGRIINRFSSDMDESKFLFDY